MAWILQLNDMRAAQIEILTPVCRADTAEELIALFARERVPAYTTPGRPNEPWVKNHREGGPLEWFNPPYGEDLDYLLQRGNLVEIDIEMRVARFRAQLKHDLERIPHIGLVVHGEEVRAPELPAPEA